MVRLDEQDRQRIYVVRKTAEEINLGSWADCETIYNFLSKKSRSQDTLSKTYRQLDKAEISRITNTPGWNATRAQVRQWLYNKSGQVLYEPSFEGSELEEEQPASPAPMPTLSYPSETWERAMQVGPDEGDSVLQGAPYWFTDLGSTGEASSSYATISVDYPASTAGAVIPYAYSVDAYNGAASGSSDAYSGATSGFTDARPALLPLDEPGSEALDSLAMNTYSFSTTQAPSQQTVFVRDVGTAAMFDQSFAEASQRASSTCFSGQAQHAAYSTVVLPSSHAVANMLEDTNHVAVNSTYMDSLKHGLPDSPTLGVTTTTTELERLPSHRADDSFRYQTPHFSDYPHLSAETIGQAGMLAWDNAQITLSLDGLEQLLAEEDFDSSGT